MSRSASSSADAVSMPRLRENVWYIDKDAETALLVTGQGRFEVPVPDALRFLQLRSHCTGYVPLPEIVKRSGLSSAEVGSIIEALDEVGAVYPEGTAPASTPRPPLLEVRQRLMQAAAIWREEYRVTNLCHELVAGLHPRSVLTGWLLEQYHLLLHLPRIFAAAAERSSGELRTRLRVLADSRRPYAERVACTLCNLGLSSGEIERSIPLLTTRLIGFQLRELLEHAPFAAFTIECIRSAQGLDPGQVAALQACARSHYGIAPKLLSPWLELQPLEVAASELAVAHAHLIDVDEPAALDLICNRVHDIRHALDLLALEVKDYHHSLQGKYVPRQAVDYSSL